MDKPQNFDEWWNSDSEPDVQHDEENLVDGDFDNQMKELFKFMFEEAFNAGIKYGRYLEYDYLMNRKDNT